jgi:hypothetical protein
LSHFVGRLSQRRERQTPCCCKGTSVLFAI